MSVSMLVAGFGGQGVLFVGKIIAYTGMIEEKHVSWLPSYGPEMRGGTANCSVCIDDKPIGCPIVLTPQTLVVFNRPSYDKFIDSVLPGGKVFLDSSLIDVECKRTDIEIYRIPATEIATETELKGLANIISLGYILSKTSFTTYDIILQALEKSIPSSKSHLLEPNKKALEIGLNYK